MYCLGICEFYNQSIHGYYSTAASNYFVYTCQVHLDSFYDNSIFSFISQYPGAFIYNGPIRAYWKITTGNNRVYPMFEIVQPIQMESGEEIVIIKTFWIRIFQRKWKKIVETRRKRYQQLIKPRGLIYREIGLL